MQNLPDILPAVDWQVPATELPDEVWDVAVIGAGPAGSMAALNLARHDHRVLLLDRKHFPREKVCGDGLIGDSLRCLKRHGLYEQVVSQSHLLPGATVYSPSRHSFRIPGEFRIIRRDVFDCIPARAAVDRGAVFATGDVTNIAAHGDNAASIAVDGDMQPIKARVALIATGGAVNLAHRAKMIADATPYAFALRCYVHSSMNIEDLILSYDRVLLPGYAWIMAMGDGLFNIGCGTLYDNNGRPQTNSRHVFDKFVSGFPLARELMARGEYVTPIRGAPLRCNLIGVQPFKPPNILAAGETIGTTYPFSGEGIGKAMACGELAAQVIHDALASGDMTILAEYPSRIAQQLRPHYRGYVAAQRWFSKPWLHDFVSRRVGSSRFLQKRFKHFVSESGDPRTVYALSSILMSYFR